MRFHLGSLVAGGLLVAGGFALALVPSWLRPAQASPAFAATTTPALLVTTDDTRPGVLYTWTMNGHEVLNVTRHTEQPDGIVVSQELKRLTAPRIR